MARWRKSGPALGMVVVQVIAVGAMILSKIALSRGVYAFTLVGYRSIIGTLFVAPLAFFMERDMFSRLGWKPCVWIFMNALFGLTMTQGFYYYGLRETTASYATNFQNVIPIVTFIISVIFRMEKLGLGGRRGKAKLLGALTCVGGAMVISLYKGKPLHLWPSVGHTDTVLAEESSAHDITKGTVMLVASCLAYSLWYITQVKLFRVYPSRYVAAMLTCVASAIQSAFIGVILNRQKSAWRLGWDLQLLTIVYSGVLNTGLSFLLISYSISHKGPTFPSMFNALALIFITVIESLFMGQTITVGSVIGTILIVGGLYAFLWGKREESRNKTGTLLAHHNTPVGEISVTTSSLQATSVVNPCPTGATPTNYGENNHGVALEEQSRAVQLKEIA